MPFYVLICRRYKLLKMVRFLANSVYRQQKLRKALVSLDAYLELFNVLVGQSKKEWDIRPYICMHVTFAILVCFMHQTFLRNNRKGGKGGN